jgi:hypothetical protein
MFSHFVEIGEIGGQGYVFRLDVIGGASTSALVVIDEVVGIGKAVKFGNEIGVVEIRAAVEDYDGRALADFADVEFGAFYSNVGFVWLADG